MVAPERGHTAMKNKILIVDDSRAILHLLSNFLGQEGYEVATAEDGLKALDVLESFRPDIMFIDLIMPGIKGDKLCRIIRKMPEYNSMLLIIISATAAEEKIDFVSLGVDACIAKGPLKIMLESVLQVLEHLQKNETKPLAEKIFGSENIFERDITRELLATNKHFEVTLDNMDDGLIELTASGKITFANRAATQLLGLPEERLLSSYFPNIFNTTQRQLIREILARQDNTIARIGEDVPVISHDNYLLIKFVPFHDQDSQHFIIMIQDITRRKKAELELKKHKEDMEELVRQRTAALEDTNKKLQLALCKVKLLSGMLPICASCKKIRDDKGYWNQIEEYIRDHSEAEFTHSMCEECAENLYPGFTFKKTG
jgi:PAS domain S-box-containing protein